MATDGTPISISSICPDKSLGPERFADDNNDHDETHNYVNCGESIMMKVYNNEVDTDGNPYKGEIDDDDGDDGDGDDDDDGDQSLGEAVPGGLS